MEKHEESEGSVIILTGEWNLRGIAVSPGLRGKIAKFAKDRETKWDLQQIEVIDSAGAFVLWRLTS